MRRFTRNLLGAVVLLAAAAPRADAQDVGDLQPYYWPHRTVGIPVDVERLSQEPNKPSALQLYYSVNRSPFQKGAKLPLDGMQQLDGGKKGFLFAADRDGDFEFTVQFIYPDGSTSPRSDELTPQQRIVIDSTPPAVTVQANASGVEWRATDTNLAPGGVDLQCKWPTSSEWTLVNERGFRPVDAYSWKLPAGKVLDVRVRVRDRAGNEGVSPVVSVPQEAGAGPRPPGPGNWVSNPNLPSPRIDYVNSLKFTVDYSIQRMGRSGVQAAHLFAQESQGNWQLVRKFPVRLMPGDPDKSLTLPYEAKAEGTYGFFILAESGAGKKDADPQPQDPPMVYVVVDTTAPFVQITSVQVKKGARGPTVEITWKAADPNLMPQPISLEWSLDAKATKWNEVKYRLENNLTRETGRFSWEVPDENLWKFYIRARAVDKASNTGEHVWGEDSQRKEPPKEVIVDLDVPSATINRIRGGNGAATPDTSDTLPVSPVPGGGSDKPPTERPATPPLPPIP